MYEGSTLLLRRRKGSESNGTSTAFVRSDTAGVRVDLPDNQDAVDMLGSVGATSGRDRTTEFAAAVRSFNSRRAHTSMVSSHPSVTGATSRRSAEFMKIARSIGRDVANTYAKLEKLTLLAKRKTLFDDRPREIQELTVIIKEDMSCLHRQIGQLQQIAKAQNNDVSAVSRRRAHQATHSAGVVVTLQSRLASMTSDFKQVLEMRTENLRESRTRENKFSQGCNPATASLPSSAVNGFHSGSVLAASAGEDYDDSASYFLSPPDGTLMQAQAQRATTNTYLEARADTMESIESTIVELGGIFQQLSHMIKEQEEVMIRIDQNVEDTALQVERGHAELLKYFQSVTSNRGLMVKIFGVLIVFFIFFVIFMA